MRTGPRHASYVLWRRIMRGCALYTNKKYRDSTCNVAARTRNKKKQSSISRMQHGLGLRIGLTCAAPPTPWASTSASQTHRASAHRSSTVHIFPAHIASQLTAIPPISPIKSHAKWVLETSRGEVRCKSVVHTTNGYASHLLPHMAGPKGIVPVRGMFFCPSR